VAILVLNGSPVFFWIAILTIVVAAIFFVYAVLKRRKEARESRTVPSIPHKVT
jgi:hypothetical protein